MLDTRNLTFREKLNYSTSCALCGRLLVAHVDGGWCKGKGSGEVTCTTCLESRQTAPTNSLQLRWHDYVSYLRDCVQQQQSDRLRLKPSSPAFAYLDAGVEKLLSEDADVQNVSSEVLRVENERKGADSLFYGWPLVHFVEEKSNFLIPVVVCEVAVVIDNSGASISRIEEPFLNPALLDEDLFPGDAIAAALTFEPDLPLGPNLGSAVTSVLGALGMDVPDLTSMLVRNAPEPNAVANSAIVFSASNSNTVSALIDDLTDLATRTDWQSTAAAFLFGTPVPAADLVRTRPIMPMQMNSAQEHAIDEFRSHRLTVVTGPAGTGKSQFVAAAVANSWVDDNSLLVSSTNNPAVDVAIDRVADVSTNLVARTGKSEHRKAIPAFMTSVVEAAEKTAKPANSQRRHLDALDSRRDRLVEALERENELHHLALCHLLAATGLALDSSGIREAESKVDPTAVRQSIRKIKRFPWFQLRQLKALAVELDCRPEEARHLFEWSYQREELRKDEGTVA